MTPAQELVMAVGLLTVIVAAIAALTIVVCALLAAIGSTVRFVRRLNGLDAKLEQILSEARSNRDATAPTPYATIPTYNGYLGATVSQYFNPFNYAASTWGEPSKKKAARKKPARKKRAA